VASPIQLRLAAIAFVFIWATGFIVARGIVGQIDPSLFLAIRFALCVLLFSAVCAALKIQRPNKTEFFKLIGIGALLQGVYLGFVYWAVSNGLQASVMALMGSMQPPLTAVLAAAFLNERSSIVNIIGLIAGVTGVAIAMWPGSTPAPVAPIVMAAGVISILGITAGTLLQKSAVLKVHIMASSAVQNLGAMLVCTAMVLLLGETHFDVNANTLSWLAYSVLVLSFIGTTLFIWQVRQGSTTHATSLLFLVPPLTAIIAYLLFGDALTRAQLVGFGIALAGVWLARRPANKAQKQSA